MSSYKKVRVRTQNQLRELGAFSPPPKSRDHVPQDVFLQNNHFLLDEGARPPRNGACSGHDTSMWFPISNNGAFSKEQMGQRDQAVEICRSCSIRSECLMYSLEYEPHGVWGGFTESQRTLLRVFWKIAPKRPWVTRSSLVRYKRIVDYITYPEDITFIKKVAHDQHLAQPPFDERAGLPSSARRRFRPRVAH